MDDERKKALHAAIQDAVPSREGELVTHWYLTAEVQGPDGSGYTAHRAMTLAGDMPSRPEILGMLVTSLVFEAADVIRATGSPEGD